MPTYFMRIIAFISSYSPLIAIVCILQSGKWPWWLILLLVIIGVISILLLIFYLLWHRRYNYPQQAKLTRYTSHDSMVMGYVASYIVPFVTFSLDSKRMIAAIGIFIALLLIIYVNSNMIYINPILNVGGYRLYEIEIEQSKRPRYYIARKPLERDQVIHFVALSRDVYLEK